MMISVLLRSIARSKHSVAVETIERLCLPTKKLVLNMEFYDFICMNRFPMFG